MRSLLVLSALAFVGCVDNALPIENGASTGSTAGTTAGSTAGTTAGSTTAGTTTAGTTTAGTTTAGTTTAGTTTAGTTTAGTTTAGTSAGTTGSGGQGDDVRQHLRLQSRARLFPEPVRQRRDGREPLLLRRSVELPRWADLPELRRQLQHVRHQQRQRHHRQRRNVQDRVRLPGGQACFQGACVTPPTGKLYCCDDANSCPSGGFCQSSMGGLMMCPGGGGGGGPRDMGAGMGPRDAGTGPNCGAIMCKTNTDCTNAGCGTCTRRGTCR